MSLYVDNRCGFKRNKKVARVNCITNRKLETRDNYASLAKRMTLPDPEAQVTSQRGIFGDAIHSSVVLNTEFDPGFTSRVAAFEPGSISRRSATSGVLGYHGGIQRDVNLLRTLPAANYCRKR